MTTTLGQATGRGGYGLHRRASTQEPGTALRATSISLGMVGFVAFVVSAWGGIVAFVGPTFGFSADGSASWHWELSHAVLALIPGALGCLAGLTFMAPVNAAVTRRRLSLSTAGIIGIASGAWFVIGPLAWPVLVTTHAYFVGGTPMRVLEYQLGYALGPGLILVMCSAFAVGWAARHNGPLVAVGAAQGLPGMTQTGPAQVPDPAFTPEPAAAYEPPVAAPQAQPVAPQAQPVAPQAEPVAPQAEPPEQNLATESEVFGTTPPNDAGDSGTDSPPERPSGTEPPRP
ncbi:MAG TPA: hypothetical protein VIX85_07715 [Acidimicrobiales bacterium]